MCELHAFVSGTNLKDHKALSLDVTFTFVLENGEQHMKVQLNDGSDQVQDVKCTDPVNPYTFVEKCIMFTWGEYDPNYLIF